MFLQLDGYIATLSLYLKFISFYAKIVRRFRFKKNEYATPRHHREHHVFLELAMQNSNYCGCFDVERTDF